MAQLKRHHKITCILLLTTMHIFSKGSLPLYETRLCFYLCCQLNGGTTMPSISLFVHFSKNNKLQHSRLEQAVLKGLKRALLSHHLKKHMNFLVNKYNVQDAYLPPLLPRMNFDLLPVVLSSALNCGSVTPHP